MRRIRVCSSGTCKTKQYRKLRKVSWRLELLALEVVSKPVDLGCPRSCVSFVELLLEEIERLLVSLVDAESLAQILDVIEALQLGNATREHHDEEGDEEVDVLAQHSERACAQSLETAKTHDAELNKNDGKEAKLLSTHFLNSAL